MAINAYGLNTATNATVSTSATTAVENKTALGKDDFMTLLLVQLQHQDPTEPMDSEKILTQTSQLAGLESSENTRVALEELTASLGSSNQFSTISAIGKTADLGSDAIVLDEGATSSFEVYFPSDIEQGTLSITDADGNQVQTIDVGTNDSGVYAFNWDGSTSAGAQATSGIYHINATYSDPNGNTLQTRLGAYPIESVRFEEGKTLVKVGSSYVSLDQVQEVY